MRACVLPYVHVCIYIESHTHRYTCIYTVIHICGCTYRYRDDACQTRYIERLQKRLARAEEQAQVWPDGGGGLQLRLEVVVDGLDLS